MVINNEKSAIRLNVETHLPQTLQEIPRLNETTYKYLGFEMKKEVDRKEMMEKLEKLIKERLEQIKRDGAFEAKNRILFNNKNIRSMSGSSADQLISL